MTEAEAEALRRKASEKGVSLTAFLCETLGLANPREAILAYAKTRLSDPRATFLVDRKISDADAAILVNDDGEVLTALVDPIIDGVNEDLRILFDIGALKVDPTKASDNELLEADLDMGQRETETETTKTGTSDPTDYTKAANNELLESDLILKRETE